MRQRFEQANLFLTPISEVKILTKTRDEMAPMMKALQYIFCSPELNRKVFELVEKDVVGTKKKTGRKGMDLWHILVLSVIRHACDTNWDKMHWYANNDTALRQIMGVPLMMDDYEFKYQSIIDNIQLITDETLLAINDIVVAAGQQMYKKKLYESLHLKTDSYVLETNVHFPTDLNLLWDAIRKTYDTIDHIIKIHPLQGFRKLSSCKKKAKTQFRKTSHKIYKGKKEEEKRGSVKDYLQEAKKALVKANMVLSQPLQHHDLLLQWQLDALRKELEKYSGYLTKFSDQIKRRLLQYEKIAADEKVFSIFEEHTEWISKGKTGKNVELGHKILITTCQNDFIVDYKVMDHESDASQVASLTERMKAKYPSILVASHSFDKAFYSKENLATLNENGIALPILPKKGKLNKEEKERESNPQFKTFRNKHSAIESNINMLEHHGLNRCMDKGMKGFTKCVALSVLAYNLHKLGNLCIAKENKELIKQLHKKAA